MRRLSAFMHASVTPRQPAQPAPLRRADPYQQLFAARQVRRISVDYASFVRCNMARVVCASVISRLGAFDETQSYACPACTLRLSGGVADFFASRGSGTGDARRVRRVTRATSSIS